MNNNNTLNNDDDINEIINNIKLDNINNDINEESSDDNILTKYQLECMLSDYAFNRLSPEDKIKFEEAMILHPDIQKEVTEVKSFFSHLDKFDYKAMVNDKTQYLPQKVVANLEKRHALYTDYKPNKKRLVMMAVMAVAIVAMFYFINTNPTLLLQNTQEYIPTNIFTETEQQLIADEINDDELIELFAYHSNSNDDINDVMLTFLDDIDDYYYDTIYSRFADMSDIRELLLTCPDNNYYMLIDVISNMDEAEFQDLLRSL